jgi:hypothetical protein
VSHVTTQQSVTSAEEQFNNQIVKMKTSVNTSQPFSLAIPNIIQYIHKQSSYGVWRLSIGLETWTSTHQGQPVCCPWCMSQLPVAEINIWSQYDTTHYSDHPATWCQVA